MPTNEDTAGGSDPIAPPKPITIAAIAAAGLLLLTLAVAYSQRGREDGPRSPRRDTRSVDAAPATSGRCAIAHARFGGRRAQLVMVMQGSVPNYVVVEVGRRSPLAPFQRNDWLHAAYGGGEHTWLGEFSSAEAAMAKAARLCPPALRCWPGEADCGQQADALTPAQAFLHR